MNPPGNDNHHTNQPQPQTIRQHTTTGKPIRTVTYPCPMTERLEPPSESSKRDKVASVLVAAAGELPLAGTIAEALRQLFGTAYEERQQAWLLTIHDLHLELQQRLIDLEQLVNDRPGFVTAVHEASRIAIGQHLEQKLAMLQSVLLTSALRPATRDTDLMALRFLRYVETLEPEHIAIMHALTLPDLEPLRLDGPKPEPFTPGEQAIIDAAEHVSTDKTVTRLLLRDLRSHGLVMDEAKKPVPVIGLDIYGPTRLNSHGEEFLRWLEHM